MLLRGSLPFFARTGHKTHESPIGKNQKSPFTFKFLQDRINLAGAGILASLHQSQEPVSEWRERLQQHATLVPRALGLGAIKN